MYQVRQGKGENKEEGARWVGKRKQNLEEGKRKKEAKEWNKEEKTYKGGWRRKKI